MKFCLRRSPFSSSVKCSGQHCHSQLCCHAMCHWPITPALTVAQSPYPLSNHVSPPFPLAPQPYSHSFYSSSPWFCAPTQCPTSYHNLVSGPSLTAYTPPPLIKSSHCRSCMQAEERVQSAEYRGNGYSDLPPGFARFQQGSPAVAPHQAARYPPQPTQVIAAIACCLCTLSFCCCLCMRLRLHVEGI